VDLGSASFQGQIDSYNLDFAFSDSSELGNRKLCTCIGFRDIKRFGAGVDTAGRDMIKIQSVTRRMN